MILSISYLKSTYILFMLFIMMNISGCTNAKTNSSATSGSGDELFKKYNLDKIKLPRGFSISVYAEVDKARSMTLSPKGTLFVGNKGGNKVYAVVDENKDGVADKIYTIAKGLNTPNGLAFKDGSLYIATISTILRLDSIESRLVDPPQPVTVYSQYPTDGHHGWKFIAFGPDGKLYVPVGAPCNICEKQNPVYASITRINMDGTGMEVFASGIRNTVGFDWHPVTKELWFTENGRDNMGDNVPEDELNRAPQKGMHFGYPYCHQGNILDPEFGKARPDDPVGRGKNCSDYVSPVKNLGPHVAALGMRFYTGNMFPAEYKNAIFIAKHGSWNRSTPIGYEISVAKLNGTEVSSYTTFASGWLRPDNSVTGRPVDVQQMPDGALLISDDYNGAIYRITYKL
ncbi:MAG: PQQ-dependent sugar dehydrogenase [Chitinophagaceae bacterium]